MKRALVLLGLLLMVQIACAEEQAAPAGKGAAEEKSMPKKVGDGVVKGAKAAGRGVEKGAEATARGLKRAGTWVGDKMKKGGEKLEKASK